MVTTARELRSYLEELLERAMMGKLSYRNFLRILIMYSYPYGFNYTYQNILEVIRGLIDAILRASDNLAYMRHYVEQLVRKGYKPFLVDCLGIPEVYEVYVRISEECGVLAVSVKPYINCLGVTQRFRDAYKASTMAELAKTLGTSIYKSIDRKVHEELGEPMELDNLLDLAEAKLRSTARSLADDAKRARRAVIISDHGYDAYHDTLNKCYLGHGVDSKLAKVAPLIVIEC
jgi:hypothetical protein